jgi:hypothetical protein
MKAAKGAISPWPLICTETYLFNAITFQEIYPNFNMEYIYLFQLLADRDAQGAHRIPDPRSVRNQ